MSTYQGRSAAAQSGVRARLGSPRTVTPSCCAATSPPGSSSRFWHRDGVVTAAMNVNVWDVVEDLKAVVASGQEVDLDRLADPAVGLGDLV